MNCGATLNLLLTFAHAEYKTHCRQEINRNEIQKILDKIVHALPATNSYCNLIECALIGNIRSNIWKILPFNYC